MISIELQIPTLSLAAFACLFVPLAPSAVLLVLCICHYVDTLKITAAILAGFLILHSASLGLYGLIPNRPLIITLNLISLCGVVASGCVWISLRAFILDLADRDQRVLEIPALVLWTASLVVSSVFLTTALTDTLLALRQPLADELDGTHLSPPQSAISAKSSQDTVISSKSKQVSYVPSSHSDQFEVLTRSSSTPSQGRFVEESMSPDLSALPPIPVNTAAFALPLQTTVKKHKSTHSFLSFLGAPSETNATIPKPLIKAHHKSDSFLGRLNSVRHSTIFRHSSTTNPSHGPSSSTHWGNSADNNVLGLYIPKNDAPDSNNGFDWEVTSLGAKERLEWTMNHLDTSSGQGRTVSGNSATSRLTASTYATTYNHRINSAGFAREPKAVRKYVPRATTYAGHTDMVWSYSDPELQDSFILPTVGASSVEAGGISQYDRERLSNFN